MAFYVVYIPGMFAIEFLKNSLHYRLAHPRSLIADFQDYTVFYVFRIDINFWFLYGVFYGIVQNIDHHVCQMRFVSENLGVYSTKMGLDISLSIFHNQVNMRDCLAGNFL